MNNTTISIVGGLIFTTIFNLIYPISGAISGFLVVVFSVTTYIYVSVWRSHKMRKAIKFNFREDVDETIHLN